VFDLKRGTIAAILSCMNDLRNKLITIKRENDILEREIDAMLAEHRAVRSEVLALAVKTKSITVDVISLDSLRRLLDAGYKVTISK